MVPRAITLIEFANLWFPKSTSVKITECTSSQNRTVFFLTTESGSHLPMLEKPNIVNQIIDHLLNPTESATMNEAAHEIAIT